MLLIKVAGENTKILQLPDKHLGILLKKGAQFTEENLVRIIDLLSKTYESMKWSEQPRLVIEVDMFRLCQPYIPIGEIIERIRKLEKSLTLEEKKGEPPKEKYVPPVEKASPKIKEKEEPYAAGVSRIEEITERWEEVLESVRKQDTPLHSCLLEGLPVRMEGELLYIAFPKSYSFHKDRVEKKSNIVEQAIKGVLGKEIKIKCMTGEINATSPTKEKVEEDGSAPEEFLRESEPDEEVVAPNQEPVFNSGEKKEVDPIVEKVIKMFEGKIVKEEREEK